MTNQSLPPISQYYIPFAERSMAKGIEYFRREDVDPARLGTRWGAIFRAVDECFPGSGCHLDVGSGSGYLVCQMRKRGYKAFGVDLTAINVDVSGRRARYFGFAPSFAQGDAHVLPYPDGRFDVATCTEVLEHVQRPDRVLAEIHRVLRDEGMMLVTAPNRLSPWGIKKFCHEKILRKPWPVPIDHYFGYLQLQRMITNAGFEVLEVRGSDFFPLSKARFLWSALRVAQNIDPINRWLGHSPLKRVAKYLVLVAKRV